MDDHDLRPKDHADTIRRLAEEAAAIHGSRSLTSGESMRRQRVLREYEAAASPEAILTLLAERQQAIDDREEVSAALSRADERIAELVAREQQAIDALREALQRLENVDGNLALANFDAQVIIRAALVSLGEAG